jgi:cytochrome b561
MDGFEVYIHAWDAITRWLHWISAALIIFGLTHGYWMANIGADPGAAARKRRLGEGLRASRPPT